MSMFAMTYLSSRGLAPDVPAGGSSSRPALDPRREVKTHGNISVASKVTPARRASLEWGISQADDDIPDASARSVPTKFQQMAALWSADPEQDVAWSRDVHHWMTNLIERDSGISFEIDCRTVVCKVAVFGATLDTLSRMRDDTESLDYDIAASFESKGPSEARNAHYDAGATRLLGRGRDAGRDRSNDVRAVGYLQRRAPFQEMDQ